MNTDTHAQRAMHIEPSGENEIHSVREFDAPIELVWKLYTDQSLIPQWWGPAKYVTVVEHGDFRVGGRWRYVQTGEDGIEHAFHGEFREIDPPNRVTQTFNYEGLPADGYEVTDTVTFESIDGGRRTRLTAVSRFESAGARDGMWNAGMASGMQESYDRLDALIAAG